MKIYGHNIAFEPNKQQFILDKYILKSADTLTGEDLVRYRNIGCTDPYIFLYHSRYRSDNIGDVAELGFFLPWTWDMVIPYREFGMWTDLTKDEINEMIGNFLGTYEKEVLR